MIHRRRLRVPRTVLGVVGPTSLIQSLMNAAGEGATVTIPAGTYTHDHNAPKLTHLTNQTINSTSVTIDATIAPTVWNTTAFPNVYSTTVAGFSADLYYSATSVYALRVIDRSAVASGYWPSISRYHKVTADRRDTPYGSVAPIGDPLEWWWSSTSAWNATNRTLVLQSGDKAEFEAAIGATAASEFSCQIYTNGTNFTYTISSYDSGTGTITFVSGATLPITSSPDDASLTGRINFTLANHPKLCTEAGEFAFQGTTVYYYPFDSLSDVRITVGGQIWRSLVPGNINGFSVLGGGGGSTEVSWLMSGHTAGNVIENLTFDYGSGIEFSGCTDAEITNIIVRNSAGRGMQTSDNVRCVFDRLYVKRHWKGTGITCWNSTDCVISRPTILRNGGSHSNALSLYEVSDGDVNTGNIIEGALVVEPIGLLFATQSRNDLSSENTIRNSVMLSPRSAAAQVEVQIRNGTYTNDMIVKMLNCVLYAPGTNNKANVFSASSKRACTLANSIVGESWSNTSASPYVINQGGNLFYSQPESARAGYNNTLNKTYPQGYANTDAAANGADAAFINPAAFDFRPLTPGGATDGGDRGCRWSVWPNIAGGVDAIEPDWNINLTYDYAATPTTQAIQAGTDNR